MSASGSSGSSSPYTAAIHPHGEHFFHDCQQAFPLLRCQGLVIRVIGELRIPVDVLILLSGISYPVSHAAHVLPRV